MQGQNTPQRLIFALAAYFLVLLASVTIIVSVRPEILSILPIGGTDALEFSDLDVDADSFSNIVNGAGNTATGRESTGPTGRQVGMAAVFLTASLVGTILVMLPITWTYITTKKELGYQRNFVIALLVLPICATTIVLLIQNNLALAFGLAAMVAAVRFRVALQDAIDGIYVFSAICVGLAAGIGHLGIAFVMAVFFSFTNAVLWAMQYGRNELDDARSEKAAPNSGHPIDDSYVKLTASYCRPQYPA